MLQYSVVPPTLSSHNEYFRPNDRLTTKRFIKDGAVSRPVFPGLPHPISTNISTSSPSSATSPSTASAKVPRSPYISSRPSPVSVPSTSRSIQEEPIRTPSSASSAIEDVLSPGDTVGEGSILQGETIKLVSIGFKSPSLSDHEEPAREFEVIRRLGAGSYAVVYLVREVLYRPPASEDGHITVGFMELDDKSIRRPNTVYGREYAMKCLSKANLDEEALAAQMSEVTIHQSLRPHPNIVTLHRTLETSAFLLLLLEYVPGEDLFYFLEQARDHYDNDSPTSADPSMSRTPPTPSLLSNMHPSQLLSRTRLRLISSMFSQMCDAVAACHDQQVYHRDIKPENFIVTDGWSTGQDGRQERKVIVKLTDFGLSTSDLESSDMDCGSAPYMSYECRNNVAPTYRPRSADVWSLGIVLINMLYHYNPWTDTAQGSCSSFDAFRQNPVNFFMDRFTGMTSPVAETFANRVFNILDDPSDDSKRFTAREFGNWSKDLPTFLCDHSQGHKRGISITSIHGHPISSSVPVSRRPSSRQASQAATNTRTGVASRTHSRTTSLFEKPELSELSVVIDQDLEEEQEDNIDDQDAAAIEGMTSRSTSTNKRRKRGARKGKTAISPTTPKDETLDTLAIASQSLAREISKASKSSSRKSVASSTDVSRGSRGQGFEPVSMYPIPTALLANGQSMPAQTIVKKPSKWKLTFGKGSTLTIPSTTGPQPSDESQLPLDSTSSALPTIHSQSPMSATASNVATVIMGLSPPPLPTTAPIPDHEIQTSLTWGRGRRSRATLSPVVSQSARASSTGTGLSSNTSYDRWGAIDRERKSTRGSSPNSSKHTRALASSASSLSSGNWRNSMSTTSSAGTSTSAFTHYSNSSLRSVSTNATSVSSASWRTGPKPNSSPPGTAQTLPHSSSNSLRPPNVPRNIKIMDGVPWELGQLPRAQHPSPVEDIFGQPPPRKARNRKQPPKDVKLDTINERPQGSRKVSEYPRQDASTSTTDLNDISDEYRKKVQKGQINALAKMLSALRR